MEEDIYALFGTTEAEASDELKSSLKRAQHVVRPDISYEELMKTYTEWAPVYEKEIGAWGLEVPFNTLLELVDKYSGGDKTCHILDICAGTGLYGKMLYEAGYKKMDAVDGNQAMLGEAKKKGVYGQLVCAYLGKENLPIQDKTYGLLIMPGCLCDGHIGPENFGCFREIIRVGKPGTYFIGCIDPGCVSTTYRQSIEAAINELVDEGLWSWTINDIIPKTAPRKADQQQVWVLKIN